jgi:hypothetical protein
MIAFVEVAPAADLYDRELKSTGAAIVERIGTSGRRMQIERNSDLFTLTRDGWIYIHAGIFKCYYNDRLVRLYERGDVLMFSPVADSLAGFHCVSEFAAEVTVFETNDITRLLGSTPDDAALMLRYCMLQSTLMHILCAAYASGECRPEFRISEFTPGSVIIAEGAPALEIFQMIQGTARVTVRGVEVGRVGEGEVFGEISFFTGLARSATVTATSDCMVQIMDKDDFIALARLKPSVNLAVSKTLSQRLVETNRRLAGDTR